MPVNEAESRLQALLAAAGFPEGEWHHQIQLGRPLGTTTPDVFFPGDDDDEPGFCVYLDGLSDHIHGNPETAARDRAIRDDLRARYYEVFEIPASELDDREAMGRHFFRLARMLLGRERARGLRDDLSWFDDAQVNLDTSQPEKDWEEVLALLDAEWHPLANGLCDARLPAPDDVHWDVTVKGRVSGHRAVMIWHAESRPVALVAREEEVTVDAYEVLKIAPDSPPDEVAQWLRNQLGQ